MQGKKFVWRAPDDKEIKEELRRRSTQTGGMFDTIIKPSFTSFKPKKGMNRIRFLPPTWEDRNHYAYNVFLHRNCGPDSQSYLCLEKMLQQDCPVCEERILLREEGDHDASDLIRVQPSRIAWVIDRDNEDDGPMVWTFGLKMDRSLSALLFDSDGSHICCFHPDEGYDAEFMREGEGLHSSYLGHKFARRPTPLCDDARLQSKWLDFVENNPLPDALNFYDYDHIKRAFQGKAPHRDPELDDAPEPKRPSLREELDDEIPENGAAPVVAEDDPPFDVDTGEVVDEPVRRRRETTLDATPAPREVVRDRTGGAERVERAPRGRDSLDVTDQARSLVRGLSRGRG